MDIWRISFTIVVDLCSPNISFDYFCFWACFKCSFLPTGIQLKSTFVSEVMFPLSHDRSWCYSQAHDMNDPSKTETEEASNLLHQNERKKPLNCNSRFCECFLLECSEPTEIWIVTRWWKSINLLGKAPFKSQPWCYKYLTYVCPFHSHLHW